MLNSGQLSFLSLVAADADTLAALIYFWIRRTREHSAWSTAISQPLLEVLLDGKCGHRWPAQNDSLAGRATRRHRPCGLPGKSAPASRTKE